MRTLTFDQPSVYFPSEIKIVLIPNLAEQCMFYEDVGTLQQRGNWLSHLSRNSQVPPGTKFTHSLPSCLSRSVQTGHQEWGWYNHSVYLKACLDRKTTYKISVTNILFSFTHFYEVTTIHSSALRVKWEKKDVLADIRSGKNTIRQQGIPFSFFSPSCLLPLLSPTRISLMSDIAVTETFRHFVPLYLVPIFFSFYSLQ